MGYFTIIKIEEDIKASADIFTVDPIKYKISEKEFKTIDGEIKAIVTESSDFALNSPEPNSEELWTDIYAD